MVPTLHALATSLVVGVSLASAIAGEVQAQPQPHQVTGVVLSSDLQPLSGALVSVRGTSIGTLTGPGGSFSLFAPSADDTLVFSYIGSRTLEEPIAGRNVINVTLIAEAIGLDEIVVVGYGQQARATVSGSVSTITNEEIERTSSNTVASMLVGKVAGINTKMVLGTATSRFGNRQIEDARPGGSTSLQIRNLGDPLFVIDGVPQTAAEFNHLNAADIESISILKDASASVYGFRAANGVVLVTTKRGAQSRAPEIRVNADVGWQNYIRSRQPFGWSNTAYQFMYSRVESEQNRGEGRTLQADELERWRLGGPGYESYEAYPYVVNNPNALMATMDASVSGGGEDMTYYLSMGHTTQDYVYKDNNFSRTNFQANFTTSLFKNLNLGTELRGRVEDHSTVALTNTSTIAEPGDAQTVYSQAIQSTWPHENPYANGNPTYINGDVRYFIRSPVALRRHISGPQDQVRTNLSGNLWAEYTFPAGFSVRATFSRTNDIEEFDVHRYSFDGYRYDPQTDTYEVWDTYGGQERRHIRALGHRNFVNVQLQHSRRGTSHSLSALGAIEVSSAEGTTTTMFAVPPNNYNPLIDFVDMRQAGTDWDVERRASYIGRANYDYQGKYLLEVLGRYDGSYRYAPDKRWGFFPGVSIGWRVTEEPFLADRLPFLEELKLRASWGQAGREQGISDWGYLAGATYGAGNPAMLDGTVVTAVRPRGLPATNLSWVTSTMKNVGLDFIAFDGKISGTFDLFERKLTGLPAARYDVLLPSEVGYTLPNENLNSSANIGMDGTVRFSDRIGDVGFSIAPNFTLARGKVLDRYRPRYGNSWLEYRNGQEHRWENVVFNYHVIGQFQSVEEILRHPVNIDGQGNRSLLPGDLIIDDVNGDGIINALDQRPRNFATASYPILNFGLNAELRYKGLNFNLDLSGGALSSYNPGADLRIPYTSDHNGAAFIWSRWRRADPYDDNSEWIPGKFPPLRKGLPSHSSYRDTDFTNTNVKYVRVQRAEVGYQVPTSLSERMGIASMRVYSSLTNPWIFDNNYKWAVDPEASGSTAREYIPPVVASIGFSATVGGGVRQPAPVGTLPPPPN